MADLTSRIFPGAGDTLTHATYTLGEHDEKQNAQNINILTNTV
jgi:hypothetical protein